ncbi:MAG: Dam family site-specific DNA-(adenine-N6)-methyltransferase [Patescibacteria group bacterium]
MKNTLNIPTFLKWAGGKRRILDTLDTLFPETIERYFEPFLGGGSVFFYVKQKYNPDFSLISDANADLVLTYQAVRDNPKGLLTALSRFKKRDSEEFYYQTREEFNLKALKGVERAAAFIYMNKTCYSGLFRVNSKNEFNVPYGRYKKAEVFSREVILEASRLLQGVDIVHQDYREIVPHISSGDFIYLDPCYDPIKRTSFVQYTPETFSEMDRINLADFVRSLQARGGKVLLSNNDIKKVRNLYPGFEYHRILAPRSLGASVGADASIIELAIRNYASSV